MTKRFPVAITKEEFNILWSRTKKKQHKVAFLLGFESGMRISEVLHCEPRHIDLKGKIINVEQGKGGKDRSVPLPKSFREDYLSVLPLKIKERALEIAFKRIAKKAGLLEKKPKLHFHSLRHGFATNCALNNMPILHIKTLMGHENIATTNVYLEMNPKEALKSYEKVF